MLNNAFVTMQARFLAERLNNGSRTDAARIDLAYQLALRPAA